MALADLKGSGGESSDAVARRVLAARELQHRRLADGAPSPVNAAMSTRLVRRHIDLEGPAQKLLDSAFQGLGLSARALTRVLKVSRTVADLGDHAQVTSADVAEAIQYRSLDRRLGG